MPWVRIQPEIVMHRKLIGLSDRAFRLWVYALCWAVQNETDGRLTSTELRLIAALMDLERPHKSRDELIERGLWINGGDAVLIHDFADWQLTKAQVGAERSRHAERQGRYIRKLRNGVSDGVSDDGSHHLISEDLPPNPTPGGVGSPGDEEPGPDQDQGSPDSHSAPPLRRGLRANGTNPRALAANAEALAGAERFGRSRAGLDWMDLEEFERLAHLDYPARPDLAALAINVFRATRAQAEPRPPTLPGSPGEASAKSQKGVRESAATIPENRNTEGAFGEGAASDVGRGAPNLTPGVRQ